MFWTTGLGSLPLLIRCNVFKNTVFTSSYGLKPFAWGSGIFWQYRAPRRPWNTALVSVFQPHLSPLSLYSPRQSNYVSSKDPSWALSLWPVRFIFLNALLAPPSPGNLQLVLQVSVQRSFLFSNPFLLQDTSYCEGRSRVTLVHCCILSLY